MKSENTTPIDIYESEQYKLDAYFDNLPETKYQCYQVKKLVL